MKPAHIAMAVWGLNLALMAVAVPLLTGTKSEADLQSAAVHQQPAPMPRVRWQNTAPVDAVTIGEPQLSLRARPKIEEEKPVIKIDPTLDLTDDELRAELQAALNRRYVLQRTITWIEGADKPGAFLLCGGSKLFVFEGMNFNDFEGAEAVGRADIEVKAIAVDHVMVNAVSATRPDKRFDVRLEFGKTVAAKGFAWMGSVDGGMRIEVPIQDGSDTFPVNPELPGTSDDALPREEMDKLVDEAARFVRVTEDGLQLTDNLPEDSELAKRGARRGDMLKTINGQPVRSMSDVRRIVRTDYNAGLREFRIDYERDGLPMQKTIKGR